MTTWAPPTTQELITWEEATEDIRTDERNKALASARKIIEADGKVFNTSRQITAVDNAKNAIIHRLLKLESHNGVANPYFHDPIWNGTEATPEVAAGPADEQEIIEWAGTIGWSDFVKSVKKQYDAAGFLSDKQWASLRGMKGKLDDKAKAQAAPVKEATVTDIDLSDLPSGYYSVPQGDTRLKVRVARPTKASRWHGFIFVSDGGEYGSRKNYGRQAPDKLYTGEIQDALRAILADPVGAVTAYGKLTGSCGACGRILEDEDSIALGIGPICAKKFEM